MEKARFKWHFTFRIDPVDEITVEESHPDIDFLKEYNGSNLVIASLVDINKYSLFQESDDQALSVIHSVNLPPSKLGRVFRRVEMNLSRGERRVIPAFEFITDKTHYCFAFPDIVILTDDSKFSRENWEDDDD